MNKREKRNIKTCELPDIVYFLNLSRSIIRHINLLKSTEIPEEYKQITVNAAVAAAEEILDYASEYAE